MVSYLFLFLLVIERLLELTLSQRNASWAFARGGVEVGQRHYRVMTVFHAVFLLACAVEARPFELSLFVTFLPGALGAQALRWWAIATLKERWNTRVIVLPNTEPVRSGPYRFVKHPNYLAVVIELFCVPMMLGAYWTAVVFSIGNAVMLFVRIRVEEEALGPKWEQAFFNKGRFFPGARHG